MNQMKLSPMTEFIIKYNTQIARWQKIQRKGIRSKLTSDEQKFFDENRAQISEWVDLWEAKSTRNQIWQALFQLEGRFDKLKSKWGIKLRPEQEDKKDFYFVFNKDSWEKDGDQLLFIECNAWHIKLLPSVECSIRFNTDVISADVICGFFENRLCSGDVFDDLKQGYIVYYATDSFVDLDSINDMNTYLSKILNKVDYLWTTYSEDIDDFLKNHSEYS